MGRLFWRSNGNVRLGFGSLADNFLLFEHRQKSQEFTEIPFGQFRLNSILRFLAKNSNARYTKSLRISEKTVPGFLAKISNVSHKSSFFLGVNEDLLFAKISNDIANRTFLREFGVAKQRFAILTLLIPSRGFTYNYCRGLIYQIRQDGYFADTDINKIWKVK